VSHKKNCCGKSIFFFTKPNDVCKSTLNISFIKLIFPKQHRLSLTLFRGVGRSQILEHVSSSLVTDLRKQGWSVTVVPVFQNFYYSPSTNCLVISCVPVAFHLKSLYLQLLPRSLPRLPYAACLAFSCPFLPFCLA
jgi:hypothetical protein